MIINPILYLLLKVWQWVWSSLFHALIWIVGLFLWSIQVTWYWVRQFVTWWFAPVQPAISSGYLILILFAMFVYGYAMGVNRRKVRTERKKEVEKS